ncbi:MAG: Gfo/Idh/MocA family oxidoreductase [Clostridiales bacterium]|nr:Gfo/Idh/MocA family oxidoreductase [Clostridiales bacterium]
MERKIRIGIFGVGFRGSSVGRGGSLIGCVEGSGAEVAAICDNKEQHLRFCKENRLKDKDVGLYTDFDSFIKHDMDAVLLCNYFAEHARYAVAAMRAGKHVLCETTSNVTLADGAALCRAKEETGMTFGLLENYPYFRSSQEMERVCRGGTLGELIYAEGEYVHPIQRVGGNNLAPSVDHWRNWLPRSYYLSHSLAPLMQMTDAMPTRVTAMASFHPNLMKGSASHVADKVSVLLLQTDRNIVFRVTGCAGFAQHGNYYRVAGSKGTIECSRSNDRVMLTYNGWNVPDGGQPYSVYDAEWADKEVGALAEGAGHGGGDFFAIYNFIRAIEEGRETYWNVYRATNIASCAILAHRSILNGNIGYDIPDFSREEDRRKYQYDRATPFPGPDGLPTIPVSSQPYEPTEEDYAQALQDWKDTGVWLGK